MMRKTRFFVPLLFLIVLASGAVNPKAEYFFLRGWDQMLQGNTDDAVQMIRHAAVLDPTDPFISGYLGVIDFQTNIDQANDSARSDAYGRVRRMFLADPGDYFNAQMFAETARAARNYDDLLMVYAIQDSLHPKLTDPAMSLAEVYLIKYILGDTAAYGKCIDTYNRLQRGLGPSIGLSSNKIRAYAARRDTAAVLAELDFLRTAAPSDPEIALFAGTTFDHFQMSDSAMAAYDRACRMDSTFGAAYVVRAQHFLEQQDTVRYEAEVRHALASASLDFEPKFELFRKYFSILSQDDRSKDRLRQTYAIFQEANPSEAQLYMLYGAYLYFRQDYPEAAEQWYYAVSLNPSDEPSRRMLVGSYAMSDQPDKALEAARAGVSLFPDQAIYPVTVSNLMFAEGDTIGSMDILRHLPLDSLADDIQRAEAVSSLADKEYALGMRDSAYTHYERAIALNPANIMAMNNLAYYWAEENTNLDAALTYSGRTLRDDSDNPTYLDTYAWILFRLGRYDQAKDYILQAINQAVIRADEEDKEYETIFPWDTDDTAPIAALHMPEGTAEILDHAGDIFYWTHQPTVAVEFWKMALGQVPDNKLIRRKVNNKAYYAE